MLNHCCHSVIGTPSLTGSTPKASELITRTSRVFFISDPRVGSKSTSQISPRRGSLIRLAGQTTCQRSSLTVNNGSYYMDTKVSLTAQNGWNEFGAPAVNVFTGGQT